MSDRPATVSRSASVTLAVAAIALVLGALAFIVSETLGAAAWTTPRYSYSGNYVSDLGNPQCGAYDGRMVCSPWHMLMNSAFFVQGALVGCAAWLLGRVLAGRSRALVRGVGVITAVGFVVTGVVPSSPQTAAQGTLWLHYLGATLAIAGTNTLAILVSRQWRRLQIPAPVGGLGVGLGAVGLLVTVLWPAIFGLVPPGIPERVAVYVFLLWQLCFGGFALHVTQPMRLLLERPSASARH
ncbi:hypothetical protein Amsp01_089070 [Amycolatopsis sp. NBRC 101858]|uniref:DUF998 domain-containing protein n=1 Tax=Amycolatopsis sp. NBRC 101858 TaxID=3032200 RepID=UPI0024A5B8BB|nr:DUF998 domain-containing protein [Amycolatopsis sp. NBRC 101858]GLY42884.1 hypothetical protein Amsp01_089070 [Amycolatopsis sp. NBRC 101858]